MMKHTLTMTVSATEPISGSFPIELDGPGLYLLSGPPEAGKSNILESLLFAYLRATGGTHKIDRYRVSIAFAAREQARSVGAEAVGQITLPGLGGGQSGVKITETQIRRLPAPPAVQILDGSPFTLLTRSGLEDPKTRQAAELKAFAAITQVRVRADQLVPKDLREYVKDLEAPADGDLDLLPDVAKRVAKRMHDLKGRALDDAAAISRKLNVCKDQADGDAAEADLMPLESERQALATIEEAAADIRIARRGRERAEEQKARFKALQPDARPSSTDVQQQLTDARSALDAEIEQASEGLPPEPDVQQAEREIVVASRTIVVLTAEGETLDRQIRELEVQLARLRGQLTIQDARIKEGNAALIAAQKAYTSCKDAHEEWATQKAAHDQRRERVAAQQRTVEALELRMREIAEQQRQYDERQRLIDQPVEGPEAADVEAALAAVADCRARVEMARRKERETARLAEEAFLAQDLERQTATARQFEAAATTGLKASIGAVLADRKIDGWSIEDGILMCRSPKVGKLIPFSDLSRSTQDTAALRLYIEHMPVEPSAEYHLILLPQEAFDGTTSAQRKEMARIAEQAGRYVLSAMVSEETDLKVIRV